MFGSQRNAVSAAASAATLFQRHLKWMMDNNSRQRMDRDSGWYRHVKDFCRKWAKRAYLVFLRKESLGKKPEHLRPVYAFSMHKTIFGMIGIINWRKICLTADQ